MKLAIELRALTPADYAGGVRLCRLAGWNQREADWQLFHTCNPDGCYVAEHEGRVVGTVTTINYANRCSWVAMVLVDPEIRRQGLGTRLLNAAFEALESAACVKLDATPAGKQLYDTLGFVDEYGLSRMTCDRLGEVPAQPGSVRPMSTDDLEAVIAFDAESFGTPRPDVMRGLHAMALEYAWVATDSRGALTGFCLGRHGENFEHLGPVQALDGDIAEQLAAVVFCQLRGRAVVTDIMLHDDPWREWLESLGFAEQRPFIRMVRGENLAGDCSRQFAITGPELG